MSFKKFLDTIFGIKRITQTKYAIDPAVHKKVLENLASTKSQLGLANAELEKLRKQKVSSLKRTEVAKKLREQEEEIKKEDIGNLTSLKKFFNFVDKTKKKRPFEFADRNDENPFIFGDINISEKGYFVITDKDKEIKAQFPIFPGMFAKPSALQNQIRRGRILLGVDKDGRYLPDFDDLEIPLPVWNESLQEYEETENLIVKAKKTITEYQDILREKDESLKMQEMIVDAQKKDNSDLKRKNEKYRVQFNQYEANMSRLNEEYAEMKSKISYMQSRILELQEISAMKESLASKFEHGYNELLEKFESTLGQLKEEQAMAKIKDLMDFLEQQKKSMQVKPIITKQ